MLASRFTKWFVSVGAIAFIAVAVTEAQDAPEPDAPPADEEPEQAPARGSNGPEVTNCPAPSFAVRLFTSVAGRHPREAPLLVGLVPGGEHQELPAIELERGRRSVSVVSEPIAPGLFRLRPERDRMWGRYTMSGVQGSPQILFSRGRVPPAPANPALARVERYVAVSRGESRTELRVHFDHPIPMGISAVIAFFGEGDTPDLYAPAIPTRRSVVLWSAQGRCSMLPDGGTEPPPEGTIRVAFVDQFGQVGQRSEPRQL